MKHFVSRYRSLILSVLTGFDRLVFRGILPQLIRPAGMFFFLERAGVRLLEFKDFVHDTTERLKDRSLADARSTAASSAPSRPSNPACRSSTTAPATGKNAGFDCDPASASTSTNTTFIRVSAS